jgi:hypothetical protein
MIYSNAMSADLHLLGSVRFKDQQGAGCVKDIIRRFYCHLYWKILDSPKS